MQQNYIRSKATEKNSAVVEAIEKQILLSPGGLVFSIFFDFFAGRQKRKDLMKSLHDSMENDYSLEFSSCLVLTCDFLSGSVKKRKQQKVAKLYASAEASKLEDPFETIQKLQTQLRKKDDLIAELRLKLDNNN